MPIMHCVNQVWDVDFVMRECYLIYWCVERMPMESFFY